MLTGSGPVLPCLMELDFVVMVRTLSNCWKKEQPTFPTSTMMKTFIEQCRLDHKLTPLPLLCVPTPNNPGGALSFLQLWRVVCRGKHTVFVSQCEAARRRKCVTVPVHAGNVPPKVTCPVSGTDLHCINKYWITLNKMKGKHFFFLTKERVPKVTFTAETVPRGTWKCPTCRWRSWKPRSQTTRKMAACLLPLASTWLICGRTQRRASRYPLWGRRDSLPL